MTSTQQLLNQKFGRLTVIAWAGKDKKRNILWKCRCDCGKERIVRGSNLLNGITTSCGCLNQETWANNARKLSVVNRTHGMSRTPTWVSWNGMMMRCFNRKRPNYEYYGGRGIRPCQFVKASPANVIALIGERPSLDLQIDRINNDSGYTCGQCPECLKHKWPLNIQWSNRWKQNRNKRNNRWITINGATKIAPDWAKEFGMSISWVRKYYL